MRTEADLRQGMYLSATPGTCYHPTMNESLSPQEMAQDISQMMWLWAGAGICIIALLLVGVIVAIAILANIRRK